MAARRRKNPATGSNEPGSPRTKSRAPSASTPSIPPRTAVECLDELASHLLLHDGEASELASVVEPILSDLQRSVAERQDDELARLAGELHRAFAASPAGAPAPPLDAASDLITQINERLAAGDAPAPPSQAHASLAAPAERLCHALGLPEWVDDKTLKEFLSTLPTTMDELEAEFLKIEATASAVPSDVRGKLHTTKGEAGVLGLTAMEHLAHRMEDLLLEGDDVASHADGLLGALDWLRRAALRYGEGVEPSEPPPSLSPSPPELSEQPGDAGDAAAADAPPVPASSAPSEVATALRAGLEGQLVPSTRVRIASVRPSTRPSLRPSLDPCEHTLIERDEETLALVGEFLQEGYDGLGKADQVLMAAEHEGFTAEMVNSLFRTFHTIKGVSGFLGFVNVTELAHATENLLNKARQGEMTIEGPSLDAVFDATGTMRDMLDEVHVAVEQRREIVEVVDLQQLLDTLHRLTEAPAASGAAANPQPASPAPTGGGTAGAAPSPEPSPARSAPRPAAPPGDGGRKPPARTPRDPSRTVPDSPMKLKETIKVDLERVDNLVEMIGELVIVESMVVNLPEVLGIHSHRAQNFISQLTKITRDLQRVGMRMRMVPLRGVFQKMARMVRDLTHKSGKQARLVMDGETTEMDRSMVEQIADPLVHMIRNSVDHGIEDPETRVALGKPEKGTVTLAASHQGSNIVIEVSDDGRGLDREKILAKARSKGLIGEGQSLSDAEVFDLVFQPGFSTAQQVTEISGRGVGMDVVKRNIEAMRGRIHVSSTPGEGTSFRFILPLTLAIIDGMLVACGDEAYIIPTLSIIESLKPNASILKTYTGQGELIMLRGELIPLLRLDTLFGVEGAQQDPTRGLVVVLETLGTKIGLLVDDVVTQQQVVIKNLSSELSRTPYVAGAAILSNGRVGLILNVEEIGRLFDDRTHRSLAAVGAAGAGISESSDAASNVPSLP